MSFFLTSGFFTHDINRCPADEIELCEHPPGMPPSLLPDLLTLPPEHLRVVENQSSGKRLLRFSNSVMNLGQAAAELWGEREDEEDDTVQISQKIFRTDGSFYFRLVGDFVYHPIHNHWHWDNFSEYEIWTIKTNGELDIPVATSGKVGYCLRDNTLVPADLIDLDAYGLEDVSFNPRYLDCGWRRQGISPGWVDTYRYTTPGQYVEVTHLEDGNYALLSIVDPDNNLSESNDANNAVVAYFRLQGNQVENYGQLFDLPDDFEKFEGL